MEVERRGIQPSRGNQAGDGGAREGAEEESGQGAGQHCLSPLPGLSPTHPRALDLG